MKTETSLYEVAGVRGHEVPWRRAILPAAGFLALLGLIYGPILSLLVQQWWEDPNYSHGFLVPVFSAFLVWQRRDLILGSRWSGNMAGLLLLVVGVMTLVLGEVGAELFLMRSSLVIIVSGLVLFHVGWGVFRLVAFPLAFLWFAIPIPAIAFNAIAFPLQSFAAQNAASVLDLMGVPVLLDGNIIHLSRLTLGVTEACSGIRSLMSLLALAVAWAYLALPGFWSMAVLVASAVPITIVANAGRIVFTGLVGQWFGVKYAQGFFHEFSGWLIFVFAFVCLFGVHAVILLVLRLARRRGVTA